MIGIKQANRKIDTAAEIRTHVTGKQQKTNNQKKRKNLIATLVRWITTWNMLRVSSPCTDLSLFVRCDYVNERVNVKLALSFCMTWLNMVAACTALN